MSIIYNVPIVLIIPALVQANVGHSNVHSVSNYYFQVQKLNQFKFNWNQNESAINYE